VCSESSGSSAGGAGANRLWAVITWCARAADCFAVSARLLTTATNAMIESHQRTNKAIRTDLAAGDGRGEYEPRPPAASKRRKEAKYYQPTTNTQTLQDGLFVVKLAGQTAQGKRNQNQSKQIFCVVLSYWNFLWLRQ